jgi:type IV secretory pathway TrbD component
MIEKIERYKVQAQYLLGQGRTALAALAGLLALLLGTGLLSGDAEHIAQTIIAVATVLGVYHVKDDPAPGQE